MRKNIIVTGETSAILVTSVKIWTMKFIFSRSSLANCLPALVACSCAFLFPDSEAMIHEAGFHSVLFSIHNTKYQLILLCFTYAFVGRT